MFHCSQLCLHTFLWLLPLAYSVGTVHTDNVYDRLFEDIRKNYNSKLRPNYRGEPIEVEVGIFILSLRALSELTMDYEIEMHYREYWRDDRLRFDPLEYENNPIVPLHTSMVEQLWKPDTFLPNAISSQNPDPNSITHQSMGLLHWNGTIMLSRRISVKAECPMDLAYYPFDLQVCRLSVESYGYTSKDLVYNWLDPGVTMNKLVKLPDFKIKNVLTIARNVSTEIGVFNRLECCFILERSAGFYFLELYFPATAIVATAWLCLFMKEASYSDMVAIILSITLLHFFYMSFCPKVNYIKAMDVYMCGCFAFVFLALLQLCAVKRLTDWLELEDNVGKVSLQLKTDGNGPLSPLIAKTPREDRKPLHRRKSFWRCLTLSLYVFAFCLFCLIYFGVYVFAAKPTAREMCSSEVESKY